LHLLIEKIICPNIIVEEFEKGKDVNIYMVFEFVEHDLNGLLQFYGKTFSEAQIKGYIKQLLLGLEHCHNNMIIHRDIKGNE
jgi:cyclin-dependent kinase 12/13